MTTMTLQGGGAVPGPPALELVVQRERERARGKSSGSDGYTLQGTDRPDWQGHLHGPGQARLLGRAERCPGDGPRARQAAAGGPLAPKWQNSGGGTARSLFHGDGTAAPPPGPPGWPLLSSPWTGPEGGCVYRRVRSPATERGRCGARMCLHGLRLCLQMTHHQPLGPVPMSDLHLFLWSAPLPPLSALTPRSTFLIQG